MKSITVGQLRQNPTAMLADVEAGETYRVTRHDREIARIVPLAAVPLLVEPKRSGGSRLADLPRHELTSAATIDELLADERDR
ncbi:type II toxin-antitoxin system Phd/YefM family antitoxin [Gryllotalpicola protaetiae]|uniref:Antitoxin n=1 Tax=Gryllotalpicola protaetiae TaxID=2419771 RepID=A0A387BU65_9MICO|nr:type II toxin-antitoxin system Phd/YefM family antitoxin [Gryllotalpicola protaetiae]AYG04477.1 type II toxin-antitoxin system Phd/YefM family antitoxin [Gryllotalpicola protaetiae]